MSSCFAIAAVNRLRWATFALRLRDLSHVFWLRRLVRHLGSWLLHFESSSTKRLFQVRAQPPASRLPPPRRVTNWRRLCTRTSPLGTSNQLGNSGNLCRRFTAPPPSIAPFWIFFFSQQRERDEWVVKARGASLIAAGHKAEKAFSSV